MNAMRKIIDRRSWYATKVRGVANVPNIQTTGTATVTYNSASPPIALDTGLVVTDPDSGGVLTGATVVIGTGFLTGDTLTVGTPGGLTSAFSNGTLTLSGSASIATYQAALDSVGYSFAPSTTDPTAGNTDRSRAIGWTVNDGIATAAGSSSVTVAAIYNQATAWVESTGAGTLSGSGASYTLDFGTIAQGGTVPAGVLELLNAAPGLADALNATLSIAGPLPSFINTAITAIGPLTGGQTSSGLDVSLRTTATGTFTETLTLAPTDTGAGGTTNLSPITITVTGTVTGPAGQVIDLTTGSDTASGGSTPTTIVAQTNQLSSGDTIDAGTSGSNTLSLQGPGTFQLGAPSVLSGIQTITAQEGQTAYSQGRLSSVSEVQTVTLRAGMNATLNVLPAVINPNNPNASTITIVGAANSAVINLATGNDVVTMGAGETLNGGSGNDTIMVTAATISDVINGGSGHSTLQFSGGGTVTVGGNITNIATLQLTASTTAYRATANSISGLKVLDSSTANLDTIQAGGANQILTGGGSGKLTMIGGANTEFADTTTVFNHDHIQNFLVGDSIDLTNLGFTATGTGAGQTNLSFAAGTLSVMLGSSVQSAIYIAGSVDATKFTVASDGGTGTLLTYHT